MLVIYIGDISINNYIWFNLCDISIAGWWCNNHLENDGVRQWEGWHPIYYGKITMFETTNQATLKKATLIYADCIRIYYIDWQHWQDYDTCWYRVAQNTPDLSTFTTQNAKRTFWNACSERRGVFSGFMDPRSIRILFWLLQKGSTLARGVSQEVFKQSRSKTCRL